ncbi:hypothetical protein [Escherichia coli]|uniref:hypothetical protein n=1 Tax=Escherichia coli TaxID=562 RepID=UPI000BB919F0|nr:hypothetical protein [Escherichia coli]PBT75439.1 hypothetical protein BBJ17_19845 [Escherichia coli]
MTSLAELLLEHINFYGMMNYTAIRKLARQYFQTCPPADEQIKACLHYLAMTGRVSRRGFIWYAIDDDDE